jgi:hypothetical protein
MATHVFSSFFSCLASVFRRMLQVFQLFRMYVVSVSSGYYTCCNTREKRRGRGSHVGGRNAGSGGDVLVRARKRMLALPIKIIFGPKAHSVSFALGPAKEPARVHLPTNLRSSSMSTTGRLSSSHSFQFSGTMPNIVKKNNVYRNEQSRTTVELPSHPRFRTYVGGWRP